MAWKRRRILLHSGEAMDSDNDKARLLAVAQEFGREIRVFTSPAASASEEPSAASTSHHEEEDDDIYDFTPDDYYRIMSIKKEDLFLKTHKIREAEAAARRAKIAKAIIRVRFPDNFVLEAKFHPSETIQSLTDLLIRVLARPDLPFYLYTTPPKQRIRDFSKDFYSVGFVPGAIVYFSHDLPRGGGGDLGPFLREDILSLNGIDPAPQTVDIIQSVAGPAPPELTADLSTELKPSEKKLGKPKWLKM
ncbi:unnamed protein product [Spirodela intermedia]|uniref:UBX domain-containing protein n=1 Tax=Spirodela intermedia TaxID=51605 RepID=A0A7I8L4C9_SPIIN|nr:unnamed protein product [Spirodela intermedia]